MFYNLVTDAISAQNLQTNSITPYSGSTVDFGSSILTSSATSNSATSFLTQQVAAGEFLAITSTLNDISNANSTSNSVDMNSNKIINLATPTSNSDAATKAYVDAGAFLPTSSTLQSIYTTNNSDLNVASNVISSTNIPSSNNQIARYQDIHGSANLVNLVQDLPTTPNTSIVCSSTQIQRGIKISSTTHNLTETFTSSTYDQGSSDNISLSSSGSTNYSQIQLNQSTGNLKLITGTPTNKMNTTLSFTSTTDQTLNYSGVSNNLTTFHSQLNGTDIYSMTAGNLNLPNSTQLNLNQMAVFDATNSGYILVNSGLKLITPSSVDYLQMQQNQQQPSIKLNEGGSFIAQPSSKYKKIQTGNEQQAINKMINTLKNLDFQIYKWIDLKDDNPENEYIGPYSEDVLKFHKELIHSDGINYIPSIYMLCNKIYVDNNVYTCNFEKHINLSRILENKQIQIFTDNQTYECYMLNITENIIIFYSEKKIEYKDKIFVYGQKQETFSLDYSKFAVSCIPVIKHLLLENERLNKIIEQILKKIY